MHELAALSPLGALSCLEALGGVHTIGATSQMPLLLEPGAGKFTLRFWALPRVMVFFQALVTRP